MRSKVTNYSNKLIGREYKGKQNYWLKKINESMSKDQDLIMNLRANNNCQTKLIILMNFWLKDSPSKVVKKCLKSYFLILKGQKKKEKVKVKRKTNKEHRFNEKKLEYWINKFSKNILKGDDIILSIRLNPNLLSMVKKIMEVFLYQDPSKVIKRLINEYYSLKVLREIKK
jgi:G:T-mismatch repair DNA endonuclease (very short patch repair protein)